MVFDCAEGAGSDEAPEYGALTDGLGGGGFGGAGLPLAKRSNEGTGPVAPGISRLPIGSVSLAFATLGVGSRREGGSTTASAFASTSAYGSLVGGGDAKGTSRALRPTRWHLKSRCVSPWVLHQRLSEHKPLERFTLPLSRLACPTSTILLRTRQSPSRALRVIVHEATLKLLGKSLNPTAQRLITSYSIPTPNRDRNEKEGHKANQREAQTLTF